MSDPFSPGDYFHVYSRTIGKELLFRTEENYSYFLQKYLNHCSTHFSTLAYCLLPNHFHFMILVKENTKPEAALSSFSNFLNAYAKAYNKLFDRHGGLFQRKFKRKQVDKESYLSQVDRNFVLSWFGGVEQFEKIHALDQSSNFPEELSLE